MQHAVLLDEGPLFHFAEKLVLDPRIDHLLLLLFVHDDLLYFDRQQVLEDARPFLVAEVALLNRAWLALWCKVMHDVGVSQIVHVEVEVALLLVFRVLIIAPTHDLHHVVHALERLAGVRAELWKTDLCVTHQEIHARFFH